mgnify:CR=1 FL=1
MDGGLIQGAVDGQGSGNASGITIMAGRLELTRGARIDSSSYGVGRGGDLTVTATDAISITGWDLMGNPSRLFSNTFSLGDGGRLSLSAPILTMDGGVIEAGTGQGSRGNGGSVEVRGGRYLAPTAPGAGSAPCRRATASGSGSPTRSSPTRAS